MAMLDETKISTVNISAYRLKWEILESFGDEITEALIEATQGIYLILPSLGAGNAVTIKRGTTTATDTFEFSGKIDRIDKKGATILIYCKSDLADLLKAKVTYSYDGAANPTTEAVGSWIAQDLIQTYGGMTASVVDTGTINILTRFICNGGSVLSYLRQLCELYDYQLRFAASTATVYFEPKGTTPNNNTLYVGGANSNVSNIPIWNTDNSQCVNQLIVKGAVQEVQDIEYFNGDNTANQIFALTKKPITTQVFEIVGGSEILKTPGVTSSTSGTYHYTVEKENATINATSDWTPASGTNNVKVVYINALPIPVQVEDLVSQTLYGIWSAEKYFTNIQSVADAEKKGNAFLAQYSTPFIRTMLKPKSYLSFNAGQMVDVVDSINNENRTLVVTQVKKTYPFNGDEVSVGDKEWHIGEWGVYTIERIRRLEEEYQKSTDLLVQVKRFNHNLESYRRYTTVQKKTYTNLNTFILDDPVRGLFDVGKLGDSTGNTFATINIMQGNRTYREYIIDEDFNNASTNVTIDTTANTITFADTSENTGVTYAGTCVNDTSAGTKAWNNPDNARLDDGNEAITVNLGSGGSANVKDITVQLLKAGTLVGNNKADATAWSTIFATTTYGGAADLWGTTWTYADINNANFGLVLNAWQVNRATSNYLKWTNFGFSLPVGATILGIEVTIEKKASNAALENFAHIDYAKVTVYYTAHGVFQTSSIVYGESVSEVYITSNFTGTMTCYLSADGGTTLESFALTSDLRTQHVFASAGTDLRCYMVGSDGAVISASKDSNNRFEAEAIKIEIS